MFPRSLVFSESFGERTPLVGGLVDAKDAADPWQKQHGHSVHLQKVRLRKREVTSKVILKTEQ